jgi:hypothetical protein
MKKLIVFISGVIAIISCTALKVNTQPSLTGAWQHFIWNNKRSNDFEDGYFSYTKYDQANKQFIETKGGVYHYDNNNNTLHLTVLNSILLIKKM